MRQRLVYPLIATFTSRLRMEDLRMDTFEKLSGQLMGFWLVIIGIAVAFGVLYAVGSSLRRRRQHPSHTDTAGRSP